MARKDPITFWQYSNPCKEQQERHCYSQLILTPPPLVLMPGIVIFLESISSQRVVCLIKEEAFSKRYLIIIEDSCKISEHLLSNISNSSYNTWSILIMSRINDHWSTVLTMKKIGCVLITRDWLDNLYLRWLTECKFQIAEKAPLWTDPEAAAFVWGRWGDSWTQGSYSWWLHSTTYTQLQTLLDFCTDWPASLPARTTTKCNYNVYFYSLELIISRRLILIALPAFKLFWHSDKFGHQFKRASLH